ncbi:MAG: NACHT domain-containing protein, partial [Streptomyces sp.]|nr:NACHT domain-containing protein [Streptomyces sp.]
MRATRFRQVRLLRRAGLAVACGALVTLAVVLVRDGGAAGDTDTVSMWVSVVSAVLSVCAFAVDLLRGQDPGEAAPADGRQQAADALAGAVRAQWSTEARRRRLHDPEPLDVQWTREGPPLADHAPVPPPRQADDASPDLVGLFTTLPSRRLVVLGEAGAGKSVLAVRFVLGTLERREPGEPVPVLFPLAAWNPLTTPLRDWLADRLATDYDSLSTLVDDGRTLATALLDDGLILPVLDGFDEIPRAAHEAALRHLNTDLDDRLPALLTSRTGAWADAVQRGGPLTAAEVVGLRPLDVTTARSYLTRTARPATTAWTRTLTDPPPPLVEALRSPLMVTLARTVYENPAND